MIKALLLASAIAACAGIEPAFASITVYTDGTTYDSSPAAPPPAQCPVPAKYSTGTCSSSSDPAPWQRSHTPKVVRFGPPDSGLGGA